MANKSDFAIWIVDALRARGGSAPLLDVCKHIWREHEAELRQSGDAFFTWQYDVRWAAHRLRRQGVIKAVEVSPRGVWELA